MNYALPAFHFSLPKYLTQELEQAVQKTAMSNVSYHEALVIMKFKKIATHHDEICESLFQTIGNDNNYWTNNGGTVSTGYVEEGQIKNLKVHDHHNGGSTPSQ